MSYAQAASSGSSSKSGPRSQFEKYYNAKMIVCMANGVSYERLAEVLHRYGFWEVASGFQKVDFNRRYDIVIESQDARDLLVESGLNIDEKHISFAYHKRRDIKKRVYVSQVPLGITELEFREVFSFYGDILEVTRLTKILHGRMIDTGDRVLVFKELQKEIPSYVQVRAWNAFVRYNGQLQACRVCSLAGHFAKDCPRNNKKSGDQQQKPPEGQSTEKPGEKSTHMPESKTTPMDTQPS